MPPVTTTAATEKKPRANAKIRQGTSPASNPQYSILSTQVTEEESSAPVPQGSTIPVNVAKFFASMISVNQRLECA